MLLYEPGQVGVRGRGDAGQEGAFVVGHGGTLVVAAEKPPHPRLVWSTRLDLSPAGAGREVLLPGDCFGGWFRLAITQLPNTSPPAKWGRGRAPLAGQASEGEGAFSSSSST